MSGLLGAGRKSGAIGTTELDYEEGTWTGGIPNVSGPTIVDEYYRRIGNVVFLFGTLMFETVSGNTGHGVGISGLPFTVKTNDIFGGTDNGPEYYQSGSIKEKGFHIGDRNLYLNMNLYYLIYE